MQGSHVYHEENKPKSRAPRAWASSLIVCCAASTAGEGFLGRSGCAQIKADCISSWTGIRPFWESPGRPARHYWLVNLRVCQIVKATYVWFAGAGRL